VTGFSELSSTRILDPPLVLEVHPDRFKDGERSQDTHGGSIDFKQLVCIATIYPAPEEEGHSRQEDASISISRDGPSSNTDDTMATPCAFVRVLKGSFDPTKVYNMLMGQIAKMLVTIPDETTGQPRFFFVFNDLGVRIQGRFRIRCSVVDPRYRTSRHPFYP